MPFDIETDNELDLDELFADVDVPAPNMYIADEDKAVELIAELIRNQADTSATRCLHS